VINRISQHRNTHGVIHTKAKGVNKSKRSQTKAKAAKRKQKEQNESKSSQIKEKGAKRKQRE
jgi:hypothetical protein